MVNWFCSLFCKHKWKYQHTVVMCDGHLADIGSGDIELHRYDVYICPKCLKTKKVYYS